MEYEEWQVTMIPLKTSAPSHVEDEAATLSPGGVATRSTLPSLLEACP